MLAARQYSKPSAIRSGVSPFHQAGAGRWTWTVSAPGVAGTIGNAALDPVTSQLPMRSAAPADHAQTVRAAVRIAARSAIPLARMEDSRA